MFVLSCRVCRVLPCQQLVYHRMDPTQHVSHVGIFCALISVQLILDLVVSLAENFVIKTIYFNIFVVASVYPRNNVKFPNHALCMFTHQII